MLRKDIEGRRNCNHVDYSDQVTLHCGVTVSLGHVLQRASSYRDALQWDP